MPLETLHSVWASLLDPLCPAFWVCMEASQSNINSVKLSPVSWFGFSGLCVFTACMCMAFAPFMLMLRNPPGKNESKMLVNQGTVKYVNYNSGESPDEENNPQTKPVEMVP